MIHASFDHERPADHHHRGDYQHLAYDPRGRYLATASTDGALRLHDPQTGDILRELGAQPNIEAIAIYGDQLRLICADGSLHHLDLRQAQPPSRHLLEPFRPDYQVKSDAFLLEVSANQANRQTESAQSEASDAGEQPDDPSYPRMLMAPRFDVKGRWLTFGMITPRERAQAMMRRSLVIGPTSPADRDPPEAFAEIYLADASNGQLLQKLDVQRHHLTRDEAWAQRALFDSAHQRLLTAGFQEHFGGGNLANVFNSGGGPYLLYSWDLDSTPPTARGWLSEDWSRPEDFTALDFAPSSNGELILIGCNPPVVLHLETASALTLKLPGESWEGNATAVAWSPDETCMAIATPQPSIIIRDSLWGSQSDWSSPPYPPLPPLEDWSRGDEPNGWSELSHVQLDSPACALCFHPTRRTLALLQQGGDLCLVDLFTNT